MSQSTIDNVYGQCPECQSALQFKRGKGGTFLGCSAFPDCNYTHSLSGGTETLKIMDGSQCPDCGEHLAVKKGRYGMFIGCTAFPECHYINTEKPSTAENDATITCPLCHKGDLVKRKGRTGQEFFSCNQYPKCKYTVNQQPVAEICPDCQWPIMLSKSTESGERLHCPQKNCSGTILK
ncbi:MAG: topoisomerase DNA-binding C4 zinc finger domain-containing protein [Aestuariibacter sp.]